jgi:hypothetical protein
VTSHAAQKPTAAMSPSACWRLFDSGRRQSSPRA